MSSGIVFTSVSASTVEAAHTFTALELEVSGLKDGSNEVLEIDGKDISLVDGATGTTTSNSLAYQVAVSSGTATIQLTGLSLSDSAMSTLLSGLEYKNLTNNLTVGNRVVTIKKLVDSGDSTGSNSNTANLSTASTVSVSRVVGDFHYEDDRTASTASFTWTAPIDATSQKIQKSINEGSTWTDATSALAATSSAAVVTGLTANVSYQFRLVVDGGNNAGVSNVQTVEELSYSGFGQTSRTADTATFQWGAIPDATAIKIQYSSDGGSTWSDATHDAIAADGTSATVTGLSSYVT